MTERATDLCLVALGAIVLWFLGGCAPEPIVREVEVPHVVAPPAALCEATVEPPREYTTNRELLDWALDLQAALRECNTDKAQLRAWRLRVLEEK